MIAVAAAVVLAAGAAADCRPKPALERLDESPRAVLYRTSVGTLVGCLKSSGRRTEIAKRAPADVFADLDGRFAVHEDYRAHELTVTDLRTGETRPPLPSFAGRRPRGTEPAVVKALVSTPRRVAWSVVNARRERNEVYASRGRQAFCLDKGDGVDLQSLRIKNASITYVVDDRLRLVRTRTPGLRAKNCSD